MSTRKKTTKTKLTPAQKLRARAEVASSEAGAISKDIAKLEKARDRELNKLGPRIDRYLEIAANAKTEATEQKNRSLAKTLGADSDEIERDYNKAIAKLEKKRDAKYSRSDALSHQAYDLETADEIVDDDCGFCEDDNGDSDGYESDEFSDDDPFVGLNDHED